MTRKMPRVPRSVIAAVFVLVLVQGGVLAMTVIESTRTVQSKNFLIRWSGADQEAIVSLQWDANGSPAGTPNLTASSNVGFCPAPFAPEYWGNSWTGGAPQNGEPVVVGMNTVTPEGGTAWEAAFGEKGSKIESQSSECFPPYDAAEVPVTTRYRFYDNKPRGDVIRLDRTFAFDEQPLSTRLRPYMPRLSRSAGLGFDQVKYPNNAGSLTTVNVDLCPFGCTRPDFDGAANWFAIHSPTTGKGVIVRRAADDFVPQLWMDWDGSSFTNGSSFMLPAPSGGFTERFTEKMVLCFYNSATWTAAQQQALTLPGGCSVD
jgi:hypothetical protein